MKSVDTIKNNMQNKITGKLKYQKKICYTVRYVTDIKIIMNNKFSYMKGCPKCSAQCVKYLNCNA
jgi:hypothetical protein